MAWTSFLEPSVDRFLYNDFYDSMCSFLYEKLMYNVWEKDNQSDTSKIKIIYVQVNEKCWLLLHRKPPQSTIDIL